MDFCIDCYVNMHVKTKRNGMKKKIRALIFVVFLFILFVFMPYSTEAPIENLFITFKTPEQAIHYINAPFSNDKIEDIIVGQDTCMAVFESGQDEELYAGRDMWLRKGEKGYKLISAAGVQKAILSNDIRDEDLDIFFYVDYIKGTKDTYSQEHARQWENLHWKTMLEHILQSD